MGRLLSNLSHGDPDHVTAGNVAPFRRHMQIVPLDTPAAPVTQDDLDRAMAACPVPRAIADYFAALDAPQVLAIALTRLFIAQFAGGQGEGLLSGAERYQRLGDRLRMAASRTLTLPAFWSDLCRSLQVGGQGERTLGLLTLLSMPRVLGQQVLVTLARETETCIVLAREWHETVKRMDAAYAAKANVPQIVPDQETLGYAVETLPPPASSVIRDVPAISGNATRHSLLREPGMRHLLDRLDIAQNDLTWPAVAQLLGNGGSLAKGSAIPPDEIALGEAIARDYPLWELLGGVTAQFVLPGSVGRAVAWMVCRENAAPLAALGITPEHAAEELIDVMTSVHFADPPMPHATEVLVQGAEIAFLFEADPYASDLALGALACALETASAGLVLGGKGVTGHGQVALTLPNDPSFTLYARQYEDYLASRKAHLRAGLLDGTLGTGKGVCRPAEKAGKGKAKTEGLFDAE